MSSPASISDFSLQILRRRNHDPARGTDNQDIELRAVNVEALR
jgi:hypothetical protein